MNEKYLVINAGSSSVKFKLFNMPMKEVISSGTIERIGKEESCWKIKYGDRKIAGKGNLANHVDAVKVIIKTLLQEGIVTDLSEIKGVGHRVLHGATIYRESVIIDDEVLENLDKLVPFGPLHMPSSIAVINCMRELLPETPQVAAFDTAFHQTMPEESYMYSVPYEWYTKYGVRRYGFHGKSHQYITEFMKNILLKENVNLIICHIGSGASVAAIKDGKCIDTSMGLTPLDGLMMGTRSGSVDPSIIEHIKRCTGKGVSEINTELNEKSGLYGIAGKNDFRDIEEAASKGDKRAQLAIKMFVKKVVEFISDYYFALDGDVDGIIFTAGIGENSSTFRKNVIDRIKGATGIVLDEETNDKIASFKEKQTGVISSKKSKINVYVIPTNEELMILNDTYKLITDLEKGNAKVKR